MRNISKLLSLVLALVLLTSTFGVFAQGDDGLIELPAVDPLSVTGDIITAGSSTVGPLSERMAERFREEGYSGNLTIDIIGSGAGYERFCVNAETDIANASRPIREGEVEACLENGRDPIEFRVGTDAVAVTVSAANDFLTDVTMEELALIFSTAATWADVRAEWPAEPILRFIPGTDSGTFDFFVEEVFDKDEEPILSAENLQLSEDDNVLVQGILGSPYAIGFFGYAYYQENADTLNVLSIDGIEATLATVDAFTYPLARPLFMYTTAEIMMEKPQVADFINYYLTFANEEILDVGYFPADLDLARVVWMSAMGMEVELPAVDPLSVTGDIITAGSSTVGPLSERMAERFREEGYSGNLTIDIIGSGAGYERFCVNAETDIANASRPIREGEVEACMENGRDPIEIRVGTDAVAVTVSAENDFLTDVTMEELAAIFSTAATWADVRAEWPAEPILRFIPGTDSGTFDFFVEEVFDENEEPILSAENLQLSEDDNVLVQGILGSPYAVGFFGYAYYQENADTLHVLSIDGIEATLATVDAFTYPLARPLFMYTTAEILQAKPQVAAFITYYLTFVNEEILDVGYFPANNQALNGARLDVLQALDMGM